MPAEDISSRIPQLDWLLTDLAALFCRESQRLVQQGTPGGGRIAAEPMHENKRHFAAHRAMLDLDGLFQRRHSELFA